MVFLRATIIIHGLIIFILITYFLRNKMPLIIDSQNHHDIYFNITFPHYLNQKLDVALRANKIMPVLF